MKRGLDNQINAFSHWHIIKWLFVYYGHLPSAQLDRWQAPHNGLLSTSARSNRRHTGERSKASWQCLYNLLAGMSKEQVFDKGTRQKSTKRVNSFALPFVRDHWTVTPWRVDESPGHTHRHRNACLKVLQLSMGTICACTYGLWRELVLIKVLFSKFELEIMLLSLKKCRNSDKRISREDYCHRPRLYTKLVFH